jgi:hypothetical protein
MSDKPLQIQPSTKVAQLLDAYPELEEVLILDPSSMIDQLRQAVGLAPIEAAETPSVEDYLGTAPDWFDLSCVVTAIDDRTGDSDEMAITRIVKALKDLPEHQVVELTTTFLPAPGIDVARSRGLRTWTLQEQDELYKSYFTRSD